jgi:hypothetical protein
MMYLHYCNIGHGNLTAKNIWLYDSSSEPNGYTVKINDFERAHEILSDSGIVEFFVDESKISHFKNFTQSEYAIFRTRYKKYFFCHFHFWSNERHITVIK